MACSWTLTDQAGIRPLRHGPANSAAAVACGRPSGHGLGTVGDLPSDYAAATRRGGR